MDGILAPHTEYAVAYIDDVATYSTTWKDHIDHLEHVFQSIYDNGITLKLKKCKFAVSFVQFLGHIVGSGSISVVQDKIEAIRKLPEPHNKKLLRGFLGMCSYYRTFLPHFAQVAAPLTELTKGGKLGCISVKILVYCIAVYLDADYNLNSGTVYRISFTACILVCLIALLLWGNWSP